MSAEDQTVNDDLWGQIEERALGDPYLQQLIYRVRNGMCREDALMVTVLMLADAVKAYHDQNVDLLRNMPSRLLR